MVGNSAWNAYTKEHLEKQFPNLLREGYTITSPDTIGYEVCEDPCRKPEFLKIAIYGDAHQAPGHVARQLKSGEWTSKIGQYEDIRHKTLEALAGEPPAYGTIIQIMKKTVGKNV